MDRKEEIHRYMLAGPFSWPSIVTLINRNCIPLMALPDESRAKRFNLQVYKFVEPGFLIVKPDQEVELAANRMSTMHPMWIFQLLANALLGVG